MTKEDQITMRRLRTAYDLMVIAKMHHPLSCERDIDKIKARVVDLSPSAEEMIDKKPERYSLGSYLRGILDQTPVPAGGRKDYTYINALYSGLSTSWHYIRGTTKQEDISDEELGRAVREHFEELPKCKIKWPHSY